MGRPDGTVQSVDRALAILEAVSREPDGLRLSDIASRTSLPASTCHRLLGTMEQRRFVQFDRAASVWHVGLQSFRIGAGFVRRKSFAAPALSGMRALRDATRETVNMGVPDEGSIVILSQVESRELIRAINVVGGRAPLSSSALGKAVLATYDEASLEAHVARYGLPRCTAHTITRPDRLKQDLATVRQRGFAMDLEEHADGMHCVASPIFGANGDAVASLSVSGLAARIDVARMEVLGGIVREAAAGFGHGQDAWLPEWRSMGS